MTTPGNDRSSTALRHDRYGAGEPLVLVHGVGSRRQVWEPIVPTLAESFEVIAVDLPGFGESEPLPRTTVATLADALADFLAAEGIERPHLAGNSMGGGISLELGARGLARSVTAYSPIGFWDTAGRIWCQQSLGKSKAIGGLLRSTLPKVLDTTAGRTAFLSLVVGKPWALDTDIAIATALGAIDAPGFDDALASFTDFRLPDPTALTDIPVTIAWGNRDILLTYATQARRARAVLPGAQHVTLSGSGHTPFYDDPVSCAQVLLDQLR
ncbi:alpha/beta fold hydrolase [Nocardia cyriacigeorgica]|uniref:alpha/beta fold hydrolase n=1 Tax=Nocardia cyriacigeorgica TaxID=135487 RepID=UPI0024580EA2|nr:alpha/beta hydrolase [Nocardia cyriacigeorgica]